MIKSKDELLEGLKQIIGESEDDTSISFLEDITDTLSDFEEKTKDATDWKAKYEESEKSWKKKYRDRFFNSAEDPEEDPEEEEPENLTYESLFKEGE